MIINLIIDKRHQQQDRSDKKFCSSHIGDKVSERERESGRVRVIEEIFFSNKMQSTIFNMMEIEDLLRLRFTTKSKIILGIIIIITIISFSYSFSLFSFFFFFFFSIIIFIIESERFIFLLELETDPCNLHHRFWIRCHLTFFSFFFWC